MPTVRIQAPDGNYLQFSVPDGATEAEIYSYAEKQYKPKAAPKPRAAPKPKGAQSWSPGFAAAVEKSFPLNELKRTKAPAAPVNPLLGPGRVADAVQAASVDDPMGDMLARNRARIARQRANPPTIAADGQLDRMGSKFKQSVMRLGSGGARVLASGMEAVGDLAGAVTGTTIDPSNIPGLTALRERTDNVDQYVQAKVEGAQDVGEFIKAPTLGGLGQIFLEGGVASIPDMVAMANPLSFGAYVTQAAGNIGQQRAENDGEEYSNLANIVEALPAALASSYAEKLGTKYLFAGGGSNPLVNVGKSVLSEAVTEAAQSGIEYTGSNLGTEAGFDPATLGEQMFEGGVAGGIIGGGIRGGTETVGAVGSQVDKARDRSIAKAEREAAAPIVDQVVRDMLNPTRDVEPAPRKAPVVAEIKPEVAAPTISKMETVAPEPVAAPTPPSEAPPKPAEAPKPPPIIEPPKASSPGPDGQGQQPGDTTAGLRPDPGPLADGEEYVYTPANGKIRTKLEVVSASDLKQAEGRNQNRDRSQAGTDIQVQGIISEFTPERLGRSAETDRGSPIVGMDGTIESGNGRAMALSKIYDNPDYADKAAAYRAFIESNGLSTEGIDRPVLIRRRTSELSEDQLRNFVVSSNKDTKLALTGTEQAKTDADNLTPERVALYRGGDIGKAENASFVREFLAQLTDGERGGLLDDKVLNATGARRLEGALLARAYDDTALLTNMIDSRDDNIRSISGALLDVVGPYSQFRNEVANGTIRPEMDVNKQLVLAARKVSEARERGVKIGDMLAQIDAVDPIDPVTEQFIRAFYDKNLNRAAGRASIGNTLRRFLEIASEETPGVDLLGDTKDGNAADIMAQAIKERDEQPADMFAQAADRGIGDMLTERSRKDMAGSDLYDALEAEEEQPYHNDNGAYGEKFEAVSFTSRISHYNAVAAATGVDPDKFRLLPSARQIFLMQKLIKDRFNVTVTVDKQMQDRFAIDQMLDMVQNVEGMAHILGIGADAISLDGKLGLKLVKKARFLGSYSPMTGEITLPQRSNSFAHEWGHALDYYLQEQMTAGEGRGLSGQLRQKGDAASATDAAPASVRQAFVNLLNTMFFDQAAMAQKIMALEAKLAAGTAKQKVAVQKQLDALAGGNSKARDIDSRFLRDAKAFKAGSTEYWTQPTEMFARAFEAYVSFRADVLGLGTEFIGKSDAAYLSEADERLKMTFPHGEERDAIFVAFDDLFQQMNQEGIMTGPRAAMPKAERDEYKKVEQQALNYRHLIDDQVDNIAEWWNKKKVKNIAAQPLGEKVKTAWAYLGFAAIAEMKVIGRRYKSKTIFDLSGQLLYATGSGKAVQPRDLVSATAMSANQMMNEVDRAYKEFSRTGKISESDNRVLRDLLISEEIQAPADITKLASKLRALEDRTFYALDQVGIKIGYTANGHLMRIPNMVAILNDEAGFLDKAALVYERSFDIAFGADVAKLVGGDKMVELLELANALQKIKADPFNPSTVDIASIQKQLKANLKTATAPDDALSKALDEMFAEAKASYAKTSADNWLKRMKEANPNDFDQKSPTAEFVKSRTMPPEADKILENYYINDPRELVETYLSQAAARIEYARRFGPKGEKLTAAYEKMASEGVRTHDIETVKDIVGMVTGRTNNSIKNPILRNAAAGFRFVYGTAALLPRATFSSLHEPLAAGIVMGNAKYGMHALLATIGQAFRTASAHERRQIALITGMIEASASGRIIAERMGGVYGDMTRWDVEATNMYYFSGLTRLTDAQITANLAPINAYLYALSLDIVKANNADAGKRTQKHGEDAVARFNELGIRDAQEFAKRHVVAGKKLPDSQDLMKLMHGATNDQYLFDWITAANRMQRQTTQQPTALSRPRAAATPVGQFVYGIMSFNYEQWRNIIKGSAIRHAERAERSGPIFAGYELAAGLLPAMILLGAGSIISSFIRELFTNRERVRERIADETIIEETIKLGVSRAIGTPADPVIQAYAGIKWQRDPGLQLLGPSVGNTAGAVRKVLSLTARNSTKTNTGERNAAKGFYQLVSPWAVAGASTLPGGVVTSPLIGAGNAYITSSQAQNDFADVVAGEKGDKTEGNFLGLGEKPDKKKASTEQHDKLKAEIGF